MPSYNLVVLVGNATRDPEVRFSPKGSAICSLSLAVNRQWKDDSGQKKEEVSFIDCTAFGKTAEVLGQYVKKGNPVLVQGRLKQETWQDKQTNAKRSKLVVIVDSMQLMGGKRDSSDGGSTDYSSGSTATPAPDAQPSPAPAPAATDDADDSIPF